MRGSLRGLAKSLCGGRVKASICAVLRAGGGGRCRRILLRKCRSTTLAKTRPPLTQICACNVAMFVSHSLIGPPPVDAFFARATNPRFARSFPPWLAASSYRLTVRRPSTGFLDGSGRRAPPRSTLGRQPVIADLPAPALSSGFRPYRLGAHAQPVTGLRVGKPSAAVVFRFRTPSDAPDTGRTASWLRKA